MVQPSLRMQPPPGCCGPTPDLLLVICPPALTDCPPLALACLTGYLQQHGIATASWDLNIEAYYAFADRRHLWGMQQHVAWLADGFDRQVRPFLDPFLEQAAQQIVEINPRLLGLSVGAPRQAATAALIRQVRERGYSGAIVVGGPGVFSDRHRREMMSLAPGMIDAQVVGEGEQALLALALAHLSGQGLPAMPGIIGREGRASEPCELLRDLGQLPPPNFDDFTLWLYTTRCLPVEWSRGCIRQCAFCDNKVLWRRFRHKQPRQVVDELAWLRERYDTQSFVLCDPEVNGSLKMLSDTCRLLEERQLGLSWAGGVVARPDLSATHAAAMRAAGCTRVEIGVESGADRVLRLMNKGNTVQEAERSLRLFAEAGLGVEIFILVGFPGETELDFLQTLGFLERNRQQIDLVRSVNAFCLSDSSPVMTDPAAFGVRMLGSGTRWGHDWVGPDGNTFEVRAERVRRTLRFLDRLGIDHLLAGGLEGQPQRRSPPPTGRRRLVLALQQRLRDLLRLR